MCDHAEGYESGGIRTVGGVTGNYLVRSPFNTECEFAVLYAGVQGAGNAGAAQSLPNSRSESNILSIPSLARAVYTSGQLVPIYYDSIAIDLTITALAGGTAPTVTFLVSRLGADGILYPITPAAAPLSAAGIISYSLNSLTNPFGSRLQIDMVTTGAPTSITFSGSVQGSLYVTALPAIQAFLVAQIALSSSDPSVYNMPLNPTIGLANAQENNTFDGLIIGVSPSQSYLPTPVWLPLGRGANIFMGINAPLGGQAYAHIAFRRSTSHVIPNKPRAKPNTHTLPPGRRETRKMAHGFAAKYPEESGVYEHMALPEQDTAVMRHGVGAPLQPTNIRHRGTHNGR